MRSSALDRAIRCCVSASIALASIKGATYLRQVNHTTVALALVLLTLGLAMRWGWMEALSASLAGGLGFDHFFLSSQGFGVESSERVVTLLAFLLTAITTGGLAARVSRHRSASEERAAELGHLYDFSSALRDSGHMDTVLDRIADHVVETIGAEGAAFFDLLGGRIFRSGAGGQLPTTRFVKLHLLGFQRWIGIRRCPSWRCGRVATWSAAWDSPGFPCRGACWMSLPNG